jgi:hypothetical protein
VKDIEKITESLIQLSKATDALVSTVVNDRTNNLKMFEAQNATIQNTLALLSRTLTRLDFAETKIENLEAKITAMNEGSPIKRTPGEIKSAAREMWEKYKRGENQ